MKDKVLTFLCIVARTLLSLRYKVKIKGKELLTKEHLNKKRGVLVLPNHPAHLDPILLVVNLWPTLKMRPLVVEYMYRKKILTFFMDLVKAIPIPDFESSINDIKLQKGEMILNEIEKGLKRKENFMLYPSGRLKHTGKEIIGGASAVHDLVQRCPEMNVVLIRTVGLWGSSFSRAVGGQPPDFKKSFFRGLFTVLKNGIFFMPRRKVEIEILPNPQDFPIKVSRLDLNRYLENWYNQYPSYKEKGKVLEIEPLVLVSYSFYRKDYPQVKQIKQFQKKRYAGKVSLKKKHEITKYLATLCEIKSEEMKESMSLAIDLGLDSLDIANVMAFLSDHYDTGNIHPEDLETVRDVLEVAEGRMKGSKEEELVKIRWPKQTKRAAPKMPQGKTMIESFLQCCHEMGSFQACADDLSGTISYKQMKRAVLVLSLEIKKIPGKYQAIMLPASVGAYVTILATLMAGKIPVMLNWTLGPRYLNEMMKVSKAKKVLTSWRFLEKLSHVEFGNIKNEIIYLEDIRKKISLSSKLKGVYHSFRSTKKILKSYGLTHIKETTPAVVLFTSGTEAVPKAVPLSHKNILSNQQAAMQCVDLNASDVILGILPPFHSFGFSVAGLFPILSGVRVAFYPDPTDSFALGAQVKKWDVTIFCGAPSFIMALLQASEKKQLQTIRFFITGAEKAPDRLFEKVESLGKKKIVIEGYGITECAPILSLTRPHKPRIGVGELIPGVKACTIHPETLKPLDEQENGEICVRGPNVFSGYIGRAKSPFITLHNQVWYRTGDLGTIENNHIILSGRLKRFAKIGGEMISLKGIEDVISKHVLSSADLDEGPQLAVCVDESDASKSTLVLFTTVEIDRKKVNDILRQEGFSRLVKISKVQTIEEIPLLGTGKTDYRKLQADLK